MYAIPIPSPEIPHATTAHHTGTGLIRHEGPAYRYDVVTEAP